MGRANKKNQAWETRAFLKNKMNEKIKNKGTHHQCSEDKKK